MRFCKLELRFIKKKYYSGILFMGVWQRFQRDLKEQVKIDHSFLALFLKDTSNVDHPLLGFFLRFESRMHFCRRKNNLCAFTAAKGNNLRSKIIRYELIPPKTTELYGHSKTYIFAK